jgi:aminopeptidase-like protein
VNIRDLVGSADPKQAGHDMFQLAGRLFPMCRSITGNGVRQSLQLLGEWFPLDVREVPTGTPVYDWTVPKEWNIREAWIKGPDGRRIVDFRDSNLHVVSYSCPVRARLPLADLKEHLHTLPDQPDRIPYRTSYYKETWGFCMPHRVLEAMPDGEYEVCIDASLEAGHLTYGEFLIPGKVKDEVLLSCHVCHPSLANDNLSGMVVCAWLARALQKSTNRYSYRFLLAPGTIGSITWLALNEPTWTRIRHGLVMVNLGDGGRPTYKRTRSGREEVDDAVEGVLREHYPDHEMRNFIPYGYDERQYGSPGINLPVGCLSKTPYGEFPEYHTSADNMSFIKPEHLGDSMLMYLKVLQVLEGNRYYVNTLPKCEPQLGRRGLYDKVGGRSRETDTMSLLWVLNLSDGQNGLLDISRRSGLPFSVIEDAAERLQQQGLLVEKIQES